MKLKGKIGDVPFTAHLVRIDRKRKVVPVLWFQWGGYINAYSSDGRAQSTEAEAEADIRALLRALGATIEGESNE